MERLNLFTHKQTLLCEFEGILHFQNLLFFRLSVFWYKKKENIKREINHWVNLNCSSDEQSRIVHIHKCKLLTLFPCTVIHIAKEMHWQPWKGGGVHCKAGDICSIARPPHLLCTIDLLVSPLITLWRTQLHCRVLSIDLLHVNLLLKPEFSHF